MTEFNFHPAKSPELPASIEAQAEPALALQDVWPSMTHSFWPASARSVELAAFSPNDALPSIQAFDSTRATEADLTYMQVQGATHSESEVTAIKEQIARAAQDPEQALLTAVKNNRVVGFGDIHGPLGPHMTFLADEMPKLKQSGITDLAVEIPAAFQDHIDKWTAADQDFLRVRLKDKSSLINVIDAAKKAGINVVGVDELYGANGEKLASRDRTMAKNIQGILTNPDAKVAYFVGAEHLQNGSRLDSFGPSAVEWLRQKQVPVATFLQQLSSSEDSLMPIARDLKTAVSVNKADVGLIGNLKNSAGTTYDKWDNVIFYPPHYKMEAVEAELKQFGKDPGADLSDAVAHNQVVLMGEMSQAEPEEAGSPHRKFAASLLPDLKKTGLTDLAIDLPPAYQQTLDDYSKSGNWSGPLPDSYDRADFKDVLASARQQGIKLHASGLQNESISSMQQVIEGLVNASADISKANPQSKTLVWCREEKIANFKDDQGQRVSVASQLAAKGVTARAFASFSQDFTDPSVGLVTEITPKPLSFAPAQTRLLKEVPNTYGLEMDRFDNVIVYPSPGSRP